MEKAVEVEEQRAKVLVEALPYIRKYRGKRVVIKLGGAVIDDQLLEERVMRDIALLHFVGLLPIVVHGGGQQISKLMERLGKKASFVDGRRVTDDETMTIAQMVLVGLVNKSLVRLLSREGVEAIGLSGQDGQLLKATRVSGEKAALGRVGHVTHVNISLLERIYGSKIIPVIAPVAMGEEGEALNVNADEVATEIAAMLCCEKLVFVSDVPGVLRATLPSKTQTTQKMPEKYDQLNLEEVENLLKDKAKLGGMAVKLESAKRALLEGVRSVQIVSGKESHSLLMEIFTKLGVGTKITRD